MATTGISLTAPLKEDDGELELGLSLSIGRSYKKAPLNDRKTGLEPVVSGFSGESARRSLDAQMEVDARAKREVQALRRQEAKRKREEKRLNLSKTKLLRRGGGLMTVNLNLSVDGGLNGAPGGNVIIRPVVAYLNGGDLGLVHNSERKISSGKGGSCGSPAAVDSSTSSGHRRCTSSEGGNLNDMKSHVSQSGHDQPPSNESKSSDVKIDCICSATSEQVLHPAANGGKDLTESKTVASNASSPSLNGPSTEAKPESAPESPRNHVSFSATPIPGGTRHVIGDRGRPPKPQSQSNAASALSSMPCVSTTGNGPNGKTVSGFLYRYATTEEVSIICICHGTSFSPAEFVQHAGSTDVSNPLRHITMVASAF